MYLRMPGQIWDVDAKAASNYQRWYRPNDGRYLSPDPIGLAGGEAGYFGYAGSNPLVTTDRWGLLNDKADTYGTEGRSGAPGTSGDRPRSGGNRGRSSARRAAPLVQRRTPDNWIEVLLLATVNYWDQQCRMDQDTAGVFARAIASGQLDRGSERTGAVSCTSMYSLNSGLFGAWEPIPNTTRTMTIFEGMDCQAAFDAAVRSTVAFSHTPQTDGSFHWEFDTAGGDCLHPNPSQFASNYVAEQGASCLMQNFCFAALYEAFLARCVERGCIRQWY